MKIVFVGDFLYNSGSTQTLMGYWEAAKTMGHQLFLCGYIDSPTFKKMPTMDFKDLNNKDVDRVVYVFESIMYLDPQKFPHRLSRHLNKTERSKRAVIDAEGNYNDAQSKLFPDKRRWKEIIDELTDKVLQPTLQPLSRRAKTFLYFGFPKKQRVHQKLYDIIYVGNNWHREEEMQNLIRSLKPCLDQLRVCVKGEGWHFIKSKGNLKVETSVPLGKFVQTMSLGRFNPILFNKELLVKKMVTPRMFETFAADTTPLLFDSKDYFEKIYGKEIRDFITSYEKVCDKMKEINENQDVFGAKLEKIRSILEEKHSYQTRLKELITLII
jgi:hypothetical protein